MRRHAKVLANYLGAAKELTGAYIELAEVTEDELNQIRHTVISRTDRKPTVKLLADKGLSTRQIAEITGWDQATIVRDLQKTRGDANASKSDANASPKDPSAIGNANASPRLSTTRGAETVQRRAEVAAGAADGGVTAEPSAKYRIVYADPPWSYGNTQPDYHGEQRDHYPTMDLAAICAIPVSKWIDDNAVLFLWVTVPILEESFDVVRAWGFKYKTLFVWDKIKHNMGHYNSVRCELLLICTRGSCQPDTQQLIDNVQSIERGKHSEKPVEFYDIIETLYTHGRKLEVFARAERDGWDVYGHLAHIKEAAE